MQGKAKFTGNLIYCLKRHLWTLLTPFSLSRLLYCFTLHLEFSFIEDFPFWNLGTIDFLSSFSEPVESPKPRALRTVREILQTEIAGTKHQSFATFKVCKKFNLSYEKTLLHTFQNVFSVEITTLFHFTLLYSSHFAKIFLLVD